MENTTQELATDSLLTQEVHDQITDSVTQTGPQPDQEEPQGQSEMSELDKLINRRTGFFPVALSLEDLKWVANACKGSKFNFVGPNEAFMVMNCYLGFSSAVARRTEELKDQSEISQYVEIQAAAVEAAAILLNKYEGSGLESAQRVFRIAVALNTPVMEMKSLDQMINALKIEEAKKDELASQEKESK